jgi:beta-galactosidase
VKVFSNCPEVELFVNGISAGVRRRESADFPAAGLRWDVVFAEGENALRAVARCEGTEIVDEIDLRYQTTPWDRPAKLLLHEASQLNGVSTLEVQIFDQSGVPCIDACNLVRFDLIGDAILLDNLGTSSGSRAVQLSNGRARISMKFLGSMAIASVGSVGLDTAFLTVKKNTPVKAANAPTQSTLNQTTK